MSPVREVDVWRIGLGSKLFTVYILASGCLLALFGVPVEASPDLSLQLSIAFSYVCLCSNVSFLWGHQPLGPFLMISS